MSRGISADGRIRECAAGIQNGRSALAPFTAAGRRIAARKPVAVVHYRSRSGGVIEVIGSSIFAEHFADRVTKYLIGSINPESRSRNLHHRSFEFMVSLAGSCCRDCQATQYLHILPVMHRDSRRSGCHDPLTCRPTMLPVALGPGILFLRVRPVENVRHT